MHTQTRNSATSYSIDNPNHRITSSTCIQSYAWPPTIYTLLQTGHMHSGNIYKIRSKHERHNRHSYFKLKGSNIHTTRHPTDAERAPEATASSMRTQASAFVPAAFQTVVRNGLLESPALVEKISIDKITKF